MQEAGKQKAPGTRRCDGKRVRHYGGDGYMGGEEV